MALRETSSRNKTGIPGPLKAFPAKIKEISIPTYPSENLVSYVFKEK